MYLIYQDITIYQHTIHIFNKLRASPVLKFLLLTTGGKRIVEELGGLV